MKVMKLKMVAMVRLATTMTLTRRQNSLHLFPMTSTRRSLALANSHSRNWRKSI
jgi:hypothetical protein